MSTLEQARTELFDGMLEDTKNRVCPCCGQIVKAHRRTIYPAMAIGLVALLAHEQRYGKDTYGGAHISEIHDMIDEPFNGVLSDFAKLRYWGLIERPTYRAVGHWISTRLGSDFVMGLVDVPKTLVIYNNEIVGYDHGRIFFVDVHPEPHAVLKELGVAV